MNKQKTTESHPFSEQIVTIVNDIHFITKDPNTPLTEGFKSLGSYLYKYVAQSLIKLGYVKNNGSATRPEYSWVAEPPTNTLYKLVEVDVRELKEKYKANQKIKEMFGNKKTNYDVPFTPDEAVPSPTSEQEAKSLDYPLPDSRPVSETNAPVSIKIWSDQELWDELKNRGYHIEGTSLVRTQTLV